MNIKEIITEEVVEEYRIVGPVNILTHINLLVCDECVNDRLFCYEETYRNPSQRLGCQCEQ